MSGLSGWPGTMRLGLVISSAIGPASVFSELFPDLRHRSRFRLGFRRRSALAFTLPNEAPECWRLLSHLPCETDQKGFFFAWTLGWMGIGEKH